MKNKILIVDDEIEAMDILEKKLGANGFDVSSTSSAKECLELSQKENPDLIILDIVMPDMNGYEVAQGLINNPATSNIKILFTTGQDLEPMSIIKHCQELKAYDFLLKPFSFEDLLKKIGEVLNK